MGPSAKELGRELFLDVKDFVREGQKLWVWRQRSMRVLRGFEGTNQKLRNILAPQLQIMAINYLGQDLALLLSLSSHSATFLTFVA